MQEKIENAIYYSKLLEQALNGLKISLKNCRQAKKYISDLNFAHANLHEVCQQLINKGIDIYYSEIN